jgi:hypothetical protein
MHERQTDPEPGAEGIQVTTSYAGPFPAVRGRGLRRWALAAVFLPVSVLGAPLASAAEPAHVRPFDPAAIHVLAIGSCPPWRPDFNDCERDVSLFTEAVRDTIGVPPDQIITLVDEQATAIAVRQTFLQLQTSMAEGSVIIVYYNGHGTLLPKGDGAQDEMQETFLLWSESAPFAALYAVHAGIWMTDRELAQLIGTLPIRDALVVLDTCYALGASNEMMVRADGSELEGVALMASSLAHERSWASKQSAIFTRNLVNAMRSGSATLHEAFQKAGPGTVAEAAELCADPGSIRSGGDCAPQDPALVDPDGITGRFHLIGR